MLEYALQKEEMAFAIEWHSDAWTFHRASFWVYVFFELLKITDNIYKPMPEYYDECFVLLRRLTPASKPFIHHEHPVRRTYPRFDHTWAP